MDGVPYIVNSHHLILLSFRSATTRTHIFFAAEFVKGEKKAFFFFPLPYCKKMKCNRIWEARVRKHLCDGKWDLIKMLYAST